MRTLFWGTHLLIALKCKRNGKKIGVAIIPKRIKTNVITPTPRIKERKVCWIDVQGTFDRRPSNFPFFYARGWGYNVFLDRMN